MIALARASPGSLRFGSAGAGTILYFGTELLRLTGGLQRVHAPYVTPTWGAGLHRRPHPVLVGTVAPLIKHLWVEPAYPRDADRGTLGIALDLQTTPEHSVVGTLPEDLCGRCSKGISWF